MKKLIIILPWLVMLSCNNSSGPGNNPGTPKSDAASAFATSGAHKGIITCLIDGQQKIFKVSPTPLEIALGADIDGPNDGLEILDWDHKEGFDFEFKKSGTTKISSELGNMDCLGCIINYYNPQMITYTADEATIIVTSYDKTHLTGTFSGKLENVYYDDMHPEAKKCPQFIQITDRKFDLQK